MYDTRAQCTDTPITKGDFDAGPLSWVKPAIQFALARADEGIGQLIAKPNDHDLTRTTLAHLHQVTGALQMIGLDPAARVAGAIEQLVEALGRGDINASPVDLFFPDLSRLPTFTDSAATPAPAQVAPLFALKRTEFQKSLLQVLRGTDYQHSLRNMYSALAAIETMTPAGTRTPWWIAVGFLEGLAQASTPPGAFQKQLCGRIDLEIKRHAEDAGTVPERFLRELLFAIAHMHPATNRLREIHETYRLTNLLPPAAQESPDTTRVQVLLHDIKRQLEMVKETWLSFTKGDRASLSQFVNETAQLNNFARSFNNRSVRAIFAKLAEVGENLMANPRDPSEALALEIATTLLTARDALDNYAQLGPNFNSLAQTVVMRVTAALRGRPLPGNGAAQLVAVRRTAQDKQLFLKLGQEILANLNRIEEVLDTYFRDPAKRSALATLPGYIKQVQGALAMLESDDAVNLLKAGRDLVQKFITGGAPADPQDAELTAEIFSHLGLFVVALQQGYEYSDELLHPVLGRFGITPSRSTAASAPVPPS